MIYVVIALSITLIWFIAGAALIVFNLGCTAGNPTRWEMIRDFTIGAPILGLILVLAWIREKYEDIQIKRKYR